MSVQALAFAFLNFCTLWQWFIYTMSKRAAVSDVCGDPSQLDTEPEIAPNPDSNGRLSRRAKGNIHVAAIAIADCGSLRAIWLPHIFLQPVS
jgi:hypothetical protein